MAALRIAIVGAGPAGIYAADLLERAERDVELEIDLLDRLPAPYGLVRYGVAPDHPRIKGIVDALREVLERGGMRVFGNVDVGRDVTLAELRERYDAVILATGAIRDAELDIPGIDAEGSFGAADFVNWYDGHPDAPLEWPLDAESVAVIGNGNVALDVARMLAKPVDALLSTEIPANVEAGLRASAVREVHVIGRRGPMQAKFTPLELRELGEVDGVDVLVDEADFEVDPEGDREATTASKQLLVLSRIFGTWRARGETGAPRRIRVRFWSRPAEIIAEDGRVAAIRVERTEPDGDGGVRGTGELQDIPVGQVYRAVGYFGSPVEGAPFDERLGVLPNVEGRVLDADGDPIPGLYATGWIKRGPVGLIGHTKADAKETIEHVLEDRAPLAGRVPRAGEDLAELLRERGVEWTDLEGWRRLDAHEIALGAPAGRARVKVVPREEMVRASRGE